MLKYRTISSHLKIMTSIWAIFILKGRHIPVLFIKNILASRTDISTLQYRRLLSKLFKLFPNKICKIRKIIFINWST